MPTPPNPTILVKTYLDRVEKDLKAGRATEHTHRAALSTLLEGMLSGAHATNEPKRGKYGAPDYLITRDDVTLGYAEAKDVGVSLAETEKSEQLGRYRAALPNLLLTDYLEFRWYVDGEKRQARALLGEWDGHKLTRLPMGPADLAALLTGFAEQKPQPIGSALELARRMARLTRLVHDVALDILKQREASDTLRGLLAAFRETILPSLTEAEFADMYAQTLAYGLFAARVDFKGGHFTRQGAAHSIPRTNPLLQKLFYTLTGPDLDEEPYVTLIDDLAALLAQADMAEILTEFGTSDRQDDPIVHFYETFLAQYDPKLREQRGVYYTPTPVVDYIVRSVDALLKRDFGLVDGLGDTGKTTFTTSDDRGQRVQKEVPRLLIMDPATGTGTFPFQIIRLLRDRFAASANAGQWPAYVREHLIHALYGFELMMAPYAVAHLKLSMELEGLDMPGETPEQREQRQDQAVKLGERLNIYLTNTLDDPGHEAVRLRGPFQVISDEAVVAGRIKADYPIMVVLGNPPYSGHSANKGQWIDDLLKGTVRMKGKVDKARRTPGNYYEVDGEQIKDRGGLKWLQSDENKFIRWAQWKIEQNGHGIVAFITPHIYLDGPVFRGMRQSLLSSFDEIYVLDLHGNANRKERSPDGSKDENVFDIKQGVAISIFVRRIDLQNKKCVVYKQDVYGLRGEKYKYLFENDVLTIQWKQINPEPPRFPFKDFEDNQTYLNWHSVKDIYSPYGDPAPGILTTHDSFAISLSREGIIENLEKLSATHDEASARKIFKLCSQDQWDYSSARSYIQSNSYTSSITEVLYRPFDLRFTVYDSNVAVHLRRRVSDNMIHPNISLITNKSVEGRKDWEHVFLSNKPVTHHSLSIKEINYQFPLYLYPTRGGSTLLTPTTTWPIDAQERTPNLSKTFIVALMNATGLPFRAAGGEALAEPPQPRTAQNSPEQPRTAQNSPEQPRTAQNSPEQPRTAYGGIYARRRIPLHLRRATQPQLPQPLRRLPPHGLSAYSVA
ncbi:type ISP restriction/modification enzyme [Deinococcus sp. YIM 134068]|uniref:type ISP restriction/modification enzyme n=1 Tax=Deinococcus lichenicola TaxID=3118910 RepID=UPI002F951239